MIQATDDIFTVAWHRGTAGRPQGGARHGDWEQTEAFNMASRERQTLYGNCHFGWRESLSEHRLAVVFHFRYIDIEEKLSPN